MLGVLGLDADDGYLLEALVVTHGEGLGDLACLERVGYLGDVLRELLVAEECRAGEVALIGAIGHQPAVVEGVLVLGVELGSLLEGEALILDEPSDRVEARTGLLERLLLDDGTDKDVAEVHQVAAALDELGDVVALIGLDDGGHAVFL